jgi:hypothetical protein
MVCSSGRWLNGLLKSRKRVGGEIYVPNELATDVKVTGVDVIARTATLRALLKGQDFPRQGDHD